MPFKNVQRCNGNVRSISRRCHPIEMAGLPHKDVKKHSTSCYPHIQAIHPQIHAVEHAPSGTDHPRTWYQLGVHFPYMHKSVELHSMCSTTNRHRGSAVTDLVVAEGVLLHRVVTEADYNDVIFGHPCSSEHPL